MRVAFFEIVFRWKFEYAGNKCAPRLQVSQGTTIG